MWVCKNCNELVDNELDTCWNCQTEKSNEGKTDLEDKLLYCVRCKHKSIDENDKIICGLTAKQPDFEDKCPNYHVSKETESASKNQYNNNDNELFVLIQNIKSLTINDLRTLLEKQYPNANLEIRNDKIYFTQEKAKFQIYPELDNIKILYLYPSVNHVLSVVAAAVTSVVLNAATGIGGGFVGGIIIYGVMTLIQSTMNSVSISSSKEKIVELTEKINQLQNN